MEISPEDKAEVRKWTGHDWNELELLLPLGSDPDDPNAYAIIVAANGAGVLICDEKYDGKANEILFALKVPRRKQSKPRFPKLIGFLWKLRNWTRK